MQAVVDFILELDKLKAVTRKIKPLGLDRYENSAEHSWQLALLAFSLAPHADPGIDLNRTIRMLLMPCPVAAYRCAIARCAAAGMVRHLATPAFVGAALAASSSSKSRHRSDFREKARG